MPVRRFSRYLFYGYGLTDMEMGRIANFVVSTKEVIAVAAPDHPGGLNAVLRALIEAEVNVDAMYPFIYLKEGEAILIMDVDKIREAKEVLKKNWVKTYSSDIYKS